MNMTYETSIYNVAQKVVYSLIERSEDTNTLELSGNWQAKDKQ